MKLLARYPGARYARADDVIEAFAAVIGAPLLVEGDGLVVDRLGSGSLFGREAELARLQGAAAAAVAGNGSAIAIAGPRGSGRSRLLESAAYEAELAGLRVLRCGSGDGASKLERMLSLLAPDAPDDRRLADAVSSHPIALVCDDAERGGIRSAGEAIARDSARRPEPLFPVAVY